MNLRSLNSSSMQGASFDREIASGFARKAISQDGEAVRSDSSAVAVDDAQVARTTSAPVVLRVGFKAGKMTAGKHGEAPEVSEAVRRLQKSRLGYRFTKRAFDIVFSAFVLVSFSWLFVIVAIAIKIDDPKGPVFFKQKRVGKDGKKFNMYKFRSMYQDAEERLAELQDQNEVDGPVFKMTNDPRITPAGRWLRKTSIDELPQLVNILKGDMSIVGPRPPLPKEVAQYSDWDWGRLAVRPGLTCYWQVSGRSNLSFDEWMRLDLKYIEEQGLWTDLRIIARTVGVVLRGDGPYWADTARLPEAPEHAVPAWVGRTAENDRKNNANGQARNAKAACPFIFERFHKKSPGTSPGHDSAARLGTLDSPRKNTEQKYKA